MHYSVYEFYTRDEIERDWLVSILSDYDFEGFEFASQNYKELASGTTASIDEIKVMNLIMAYRNRGHLIADTNPLKPRKDRHANLDLAYFGLTEKDLGRTFNAGAEVGIGASTLTVIIDTLQKRYCKTLGFEFNYIRDPEEWKWFRGKVEINPNIVDFSIEKKTQILRKLNQAVVFEQFLGKKYIGEKRFSLEGGEATIPALHFIINAAADKNAEEVVIGMAHRGRLNVLSNIIGKTYEQIFSEFEGNEPTNAATMGDGDVKYHLGLTSDRKTRTGKHININLAPNPSHLETVGAVIEGITRAKQDKYFPNDFSKVLPIAVHGDAAVAGQGIVYEIIQMAQLDGYKTGGTIHIVINNQVGFTTNYLDARSSTYCTDVAKVTLSPVLHVNADDAEAVVHAMLFALDYRMQFGSDVFIDLLGYRKYGHNEGDEPRFTQPLLYKTIASHKNPRDIYTAKLIDEGVIDATYIKGLETAYKDKLEVNLEKSRKKDLTIITPFMQNEWLGFEQVTNVQMLEKVDTSYNKKGLTNVANAVCNLPSDKKFISKIQKLINDRKTMFFETNKLDWAMAEHLAYGSLLQEGYNVRISGQDVERGTFSHRHAVVKVENSEEEVTLLNNIEGKKGNFNVFNSLLSEYGVLGFDYGYALASPKTLTIWEAQFGDFSNGAQIMLDQYISCGEDKWNNQNGIVLLLPHGYENQGAEHSSARMERYLQLCARNNMYVADCTTPANFYHLLRRQMKTTFRKPLIVFSPKSLLRDPRVVSPIEDFEKGCFQETIDDTTVNKKDVKTLVFCTGKFYYDITAERENNGRKDVAVVRIEQLFPFPVEQLKEIIAKYPNADDYVWAQEEPRNMGAYSFMLMNFDLVKWRLASLRAYAAPASGSYTRAKRRHADAIKMVFDKDLFRK